MVVGSVASISSATTRQRGKRLPPASSGTAPEASITEGADRDLRIMVRRRENRALLLGASSDESGEGRRSEWRDEEKERIKEMA